MITAPQLAILLKGYRYSDEEIKAFSDTINNIFSKFSINSPLRQAHFLGQIFHETLALKYSEELWGNTPAQQKYEMNKMLGNNEPGDGKNYKGRGWLQTTGKYNYSKLSEQLKVDFVASPELLAKQPYCGLAAGIFWNNHNLNKYADLDDIVTITHIINGGQNGINDRILWVNKVKSILN